jgi:hypothetical protein
VLQVPRSMPISRLNQPSIESKNMATASLRLLGQNPWVDRTRRRALHGKKMHGNTGSLAEL